MATTSTSKKSSEWSFARREKLAKLVKIKVPRAAKKNAQHRNFTDEAKKKLPKLFAQIEAHNKAETRREKEEGQRVSREFARKLDLARFGSAEDCDKLAKELIDLPDNSHWERNSG